MTTMWLHTMDEIGMTPLTRAARCGRHEVANVMMLREEIDNPVNFKNLPEIHRAACWGFGDVIEDLAEDGYDVNDIDNVGETPLHKAARLDNADAARALLENGANANLRDAIGMTALHWAALTGNVEMTELLLMYSADLHVRDYISGGMTPLDIAGLMGYDEVTDAMRNRYATL